MSRKKINQMIVYTLANFSTDNLMLSILVAKDNLTYPGDPKADPGTVSYTHLTLPTKA